MSVGSIPYCGDCLGLNLHPCAHVRCKVSIVIFFLLLAPGQPSAGGPRMDRRALTSPGVVKISRLACPTPSRHSQSARNDPPV